VFDVKSVELRWMHLHSFIKDVFLLGDFNLPDIDWFYYHSPDNMIYNSFLKFVNSYGFTQFVNQPTRDNILDLVLSTSTNSISKIDMNTFIR